MRGSQSVWTEAAGWSDRTAPAEADLVLVFGERAAMAPGRLEEIRRTHPKAKLFGCSTAGEIADTAVRDGSLVVTALSFRDTPIRLVSAAIKNPTESAAVGSRLARELLDPALAHVIVLSDGLTINGTELVDGIRSVLGDRVGVSGGLSGDAGRFEATTVIADTQVGSGLVAAVGLYGSAIGVGCASLGGWDPFGPERIVTRAAGNVLYELDGRSALQLYREYLGDHAAGLPATGLLFPLSVRTDDRSDPLVRTILGIDESAQSLIFAGDVPQGALTRLMRASNDRLIDGAAGAARVVSEEDPAAADFALLISCVGRKLLLKQRTEEEIEAVRDVLGPKPLLTGFYSYGEISPRSRVARCELHNQTMAITTLREA